MVEQATLMPFPTVRELIVVKRQMLGLTQSEVARIAHIPPQHLAKLETKPAAYYRPMTLRALSGALDIDLSLLLGAAGYIPRMARVVLTTSERP